MSVASVASVRSGVAGPWPSPLRAAPLGSLGSLASAAGDFHQGAATNDSVNATQMDPLPDTQVDTAPEEDPAAAAAEAARKAAARPWGKLIPLWGSGEHQLLRRRPAAPAPLRPVWARGLASLPGTDLSSDLDHKTQEAIQDAAERRQTGVSLKTLLDTGRGDLLQKLDSVDPTSTATEQMLIQVACFLHHELPIRLARRVVDLQRIKLLRDMESVQLVHRWYAQSFQELLNSPPPNTIEREADFAKLLQNIYQRHAATLLTMAQGAYELRREISKSDGVVAFEDHREIHNFLDSFYMSRIGIRVLIGQYLALRQPPVDSYIGLVQTATSPAQVAQAAVEDATYMCERQYGEAPNVTLHGCLDRNFAYVPTHLHYILLELLKNSMRATCEFHGDADYLPDVKIILADGDSNEDVVIKVSDEGGGIRRSHMKRIWSYLFTTADPEIQKGFVEIGGAETDFDTHSPLAGLGYGLPISRSYARYFGGDMQIMSMEGFGTDAFVHLNRLGDADEPLP
uniref:Protein-serine/threonine kinase n=1 Tax=Phaeomonas parva TaxID=124430 RepID=A0A6U4CVZ3_9STRA|mmetsp:Transcript_1426/g.3686  ORF Transcript_1426/g.3686 Transcript_1426/m.3686 type:complete len:513 (+) Transcript_1426:333-1871(+)